MKFISEEQSSALINHELAFEAAREALIAVVSEGASIFPAVLAMVSPEGHRFSMKSGATPDVVGLKVGSFWPTNGELGLPRHNSAILLIDQRVGRVEWVIEAGKVNAYRTAAADAVAVEALAREDASILTVFGAGNQAKYECEAISRIRPIKEILVVARDQEKGAAFANELTLAGLSARAANAQTACECADIIVTATPSRAPLFEAKWVRPGTHISAMGSDAEGKQELPPELLRDAALFCDLPSQSLAMGEFQYFTGDPSRIAAIGSVLTGQASGRTSADQITVFDSSGISLQDLYVARHLIAQLEANSL